MKKLLHPVTTTSVPQSVHDFSTYFTSEVDNFRPRTANAPPANITRPAVPLFTGFHGVTVEGVSLLISESSNKQCELDPIPTWLVKDVLAQQLETWRTRPLVRRNFLTHTHTQLYVPELRSRRLIRMT